MMMAGRVPRPDRDVLRAPMTLGTLPFAMEQFTIAFVDMTPTGGRMTQFGLRFSW